MVLGELGVSRPTLGDIAPSKSVARISQAVPRLFRFDLRDGVKGLGKPDFGGFSGLGFVLFSGLGAGGEDGW